MSFPPEVTVRHPTMADAPSVTALVNAAERLHLGETLIEQSEIEADWAGPFIDTASDVILVEEDGRLVAWAQVYRDRGDADVHPDALGRGLGSGLIDWMEQWVLERTPADQTAVLRQAVADNDSAAASLLLGRGYQHRWSSWVLRLPPDIEINRADLDENVEIRPFRRDEERIVHQIIEEAFNEWEGRLPTSFEGWRSQTTARSDFDPSLLFVATDRGEVVGACVAVHYPGEGWVDQIAVDRGHRGRGLGRAMLIEAFSRFRAEGERRIGLSTDSRTGALDLYLHLGMVVEQEFTNWGKVLRLATDRAG